MMTKIESWMINIALVIVMLSLLCFEWSEASPSPSPAPGPAPKKPPPPGVVIVHKPSGEILIIFLFVGLVMGAISLFVLSRLKRHFPYAVLMFVEGILMGIIMHHSNTDNEFISSLNKWANISPDLLKYLFLPALVSH
jgi:hypothetical protein